ncbi:MULTISPECIES: 3-oxoacyl-ACP synthase III family protein [Rhizobium]|uniref:3-oxoacyl-[acyl-carrier-protein] synthase III C-terminal domain-containing protein n=1 Tax=Rhizobium rhododendri TaxID=2506430 RepID=A0ABY8IQG0_9HYPH|nr:MULTISPECIES: 3-oxoacyl-[acyl-carrier-protein] synthase III C-terminal domain-containing protein [Rhizobium]TQX85179.1 ketoacyl-ACP synthase III [Rhizobium sp. rho-13.1]TQY09467.1 ketoacyl-ACP synthase III [Rhizobium sp. rho-1.1]WFS25949.1 3-oxoacyl-[acyl-carrier-protein] synthase III C-terminal domain-containing protein [Rhizobium rhododendri]
MHRVAEERRLSGMTIVGTGRSVPRRAVASSDLDNLHGFPGGYLQSVTGVHTRYVCDDENQIDLACDAARKALDAAGLRPQDLDMIISASAVAYQPIPGMAPAIQRALGIADGACFSTDINSTCLSFPVALHFASSLLQTGNHRTILIVSSEIASRALPWKAQPAVAGLFGDGAGAAIIRADDRSGILASRFTTLSSGYDACQIGAGGTRFDFHREPEEFTAHSTFSMDGKELFRLTARDFAAFVSALLAAANTRHNEIARVIAHQASPGALAHMTRICNFAPGQVIDISAQFGNQIAASIPFVLDYGVEHQLIHRGDRIMILGTSAGVSFGGLVVDL